MSDNTLVVSDSVLPSALKILPLTAAPVFPGIFTPFHISDDDDMKAVEAALEEGSGYIGLVLLKNREKENEDPKLYRIGTVAKIVKRINLPDDTVNIFISTMKRFKIRRLSTKEGIITAQVAYLEDEDPDTVMSKALTRQLIKEVRDIADSNPLITEEIKLNLVNIDNPGKIADFTSSILNIEKEIQQKILETVNITDRIELVLKAIQKEKEVIRVQKRVQSDIEKKIDKAQREFFLKEELKEIKKELGIDTDPKSDDYDRLKEKIDAFEFTGEIKEQVEAELEKLAVLDINSSEYFVTKNYLDTVAALPWKEEPEKEPLSLTAARKILDRDHYGMKEVKDRIIEFLGVRMLKQDKKGAIICLVGPPGVGKTSVGKSIAAALGKPFYRFSVGGMRDEAEIKGHRRTYIGAMPGKILQGLKIVKSKAPVFLIDEIDKMGSSHQDDPASALLEALDPEQNVQFRDHYLDLPFDLSQILFVVTANTLETIPRPLLDRMEVIELSGYITKEKVKIASKYLIPKALKENGLSKENLTFTPTALTALIDSYARESGVRNLEKAIHKICRKTAVRLVDDTNEEKKAVTVTPESLRDFLGMAVFNDDDIKTADVPGTVIGLAWTAYGGDTLIIETLANPSPKGGFKLTGQMGDVMQESAAISYSRVVNILPRYRSESRFFAENLIHIHIPAGATPKDGPSAGITMATALLSLALNKKIKPHFAMTGELSLTGRVLPIGGLKEKTIAAKRNKIKLIIIPKANLKDLEEIPEEVKSGITFYPVSRFDEVVDLIFERPL